MYSEKANAVWLIKDAMNKTVSKCIAMTIVNNMKQLQFNLWLNVFSYCVEYLAMFNAYWHTLLIPCTCYN